MNPFLQSNPLTLKNGLTVYPVPFQGINSVFLHAWVSVGSADETKFTNGISHMLEHMMFRGNHSLGSGYELNLKMEEMGGELNAATSFDYTEYWIRIHKDFIEQGIRFFCRFLNQPKFEDLEIERGIILEEILSEFNEDKNLINIDSLSSTLLWPEHPIGFPIIGSKKNIEGFGIDDLKHWHETYYKPGNLILGIAGDIDPRKIVGIIEEEFEDLPASARSSYPEAFADPEKGRQLQWVPDKDNQYQIQWSFPINGLTPELKFCLQLIGRILDDGSSSRIQRLIREEKGLVYDVSATMLYYNSGAVLNIQSFVGNEKLFELIDELIGLLENLVKNGVEPKELELAKSRYRIFLDCFTDTAKGLLIEKVGQEIFPCYSSIEETLKQLENIEIEEVNQTMVRLLSQKETTFVVIGPDKDKLESELFKKLKPWMK